MLIKLGIIGAILILEKPIFSSEINVLFPNTSSVAKLLEHDDINNISIKTTICRKKT